MPIDFTRIPPRVPVPPPPSPSKLAWSVLLGAVICLGAALVVFAWPAGMATNTGRFWLYAIGYPILAWAFLLCSNLAYQHTRRSEAIATNLVSAREEQRCHARASQPLGIFGQAWRFSSNPNENRLASILDGSVQPHPRSSHAERNVDVTARWFEIPGRVFYAGNVLTEYTRHEEIYKWLLLELIDQLAPQLHALPKHTKLHVEVDLRSLLAFSEFRANLQQQIARHFPALRVIVGPSETPIPLRHADAWHDLATPWDAYLLLSVQLRGAVSMRLQDGATEAGVALLVGQPAMASRMATGPSPVHLHRPAIGTPETADETLALALRWGATEAVEITTVWTHAIPPALLQTLRSLPRLDQVQAQWLSLDTTVGDCADTGGWLATALAAEHAANRSGPQLLLSQQGNSLIALVCKKSS